MKIGTNDVLEHSIEYAGESSVIVYWHQAPHQIASQIQALSRQINNHFAEQVVELIPSYASLLVTFDIFLVSVDEAIVVIKHLLDQIDLEPNLTFSSSKLITLPVYYHPDVGVDLTRIAAHANLSVEQVVEIHQQLEYRVFAIGFAPGFAYLGDVDKRIAAPRLATPRAQVPKGAVAIADQQTAVYPNSSPGGWNIVGLCPLDLFNPHTEPHLPFSVGDKVKFEAVDKATFIELGGRLS